MIAGMERGNEPASLKSNLGNEASEHHRGLTTTRGAYHHDKRLFVYSFHQLFYSSFSPKEERSILLLKSRQTTIWTGTQLRPNFDQLYRRNDISSFVTCLSIGFDDYPNDTL